MKKRFYLIPMLVLMLVGVIYADELEKLMKEVRLAYKELKKESKNMDTTVLKKLLQKMDSLGEKMKEQKIEENQERFNELSQEFRSKVQELIVLSERKDPEEFRKGMGELKQTCVKCHGAFMNPVKRFFLDLFL